MGMQIPSCVHTEIQAEDYLQSIQGEHGRDSQRFIIYSPPSAFVSEIYTRIPDLYPAGQIRLRL